MAGAGYKLFVTGDVLTAAQVNTYLQEQTVMRFASAAARTSALTAVLAEGMMSYLVDTNAVEVYDGANWVSIGSTGDITGVTAGTGISGGGTSGTVTVTNSMATAIITAGDLIKGTGSGTFDRLGIGSTGQVLTVTAGAPAWEAAPGFGAYTSWTPIIDQGGSTNIAQSGTQAYYATSGEFVHAYGAVNLNGAGSAGSIIYVSYPVAPNAAMNQVQGIGSGGFYDSSTALFYVGTPVRSTASRMSLRPTNDSTFANSSLGNAVFTGALAAGDAFYFNITYRK
jgi:hypothetical protein